MERHGAVTVGAKARVGVFIAVEDGKSEAVDIELHGARQVAHIHNGVIEGQLRTALSFLRALSFRRFFCLSRRHGLGPRNSELETRNSLPCLFSPCPRYLRTLRALCLPAAGRLQTAAARNERRSVHLNCSRSRLVSSPNRKRLRGHAPWF